MGRTVAATVALVVLATGCTAATTAPAAEPSSGPAPAQSAEVGWVEPTAEETPRLVFEVTRVEISTTGWRAGVAIRNETEVPWAVGDPRAGSPVPFGVMLFTVGELEDLQRRSRDGELPGIRSAHAVTPSPPRELAPGASWEGTISAPGALAGNTWLRVVFGPLVTEGEPPASLGRQFVWITDNAYRLRV